MVVVVVYDGRGRWGVVRKEKGHGDSGSGCGIGLVWCGVVRT